MIQIAVQAAVTALDPQDHQTAGDEGQRHRHRVKQMRLDGLAKGQPEHHRRDEGDEHIEREAPRCGVGAQPHHRALQPLAVLPDHGEHGAGLDGDLEDLGGLAGEADERAGQDQVTGARDRQELGESLDDAHEGGFQQQRDVQGISRRGVGRMIGGRCVSATVKLRRCASRATR